MTLADLEARIAALESAHRATPPARGEVPCVAASQDASGEWFVSINGERFWFDEKNDALELCDALNKWLAAHWPRVAEDDDLRAVGGELAAALKKIQTLEKALMADRGDWIPPTDVRVWQDRDIRELRTIVPHLCRDNYIWCRAALNALADLTAERNCLTAERDALAARVRELEELRTKEECCECTRDEVLRDRVARDAYIQNQVGRRIADAAAKEREDAHRKLADFARDLFKSGEMCLDKVEGAERIARAHTVEQCISLLGFPTPTTGEKPEVVATDIDRDRASYFPGEAPGKDLRKVAASSTTQSADRGGREGKMPDAPVDPGEGRGADPRHGLSASVAHPHSSPPSVEELVRVEHEHDGYGHSVYVTVCGSRVETFDADTAEADAADLRVALNEHITRLVTDAQRAAYERALSKLEEDGVCTPDVRDSIRRLLDVEVGG